MANEKKAAKKEAVAELPDLDELTLAAYSGPAVYANRFSVSIGEGGVRISALEQQTKGAPLHFRAAIQTSFAQATALKEVLARLLKDLEDKINEAEQQAKITDEKTETTENG